MGVSRTDYVIFGVDVGYDNVDYDTFEKEIGQDPDAEFAIIYDGMCGKYAYAGMIIAKADPYEGFGNGVELTPLDITAYDVAKKVMAKFPHARHTEFRIRAVSHFH